MLLINYSLSSECSHISHGEWKFLFFSLYVISTTPTMVAIHRVEPFVHLLVEVSSAMINMNYVCSYLRHKYPPHFVPVLKDPFIHLFSWTAFPIFESFLCQIPGHSANCQWLYTSKSRFIPSSPRKSNLLGKPHNCSKFYLQGGCPSNNSFGTTAASHFWVVLGKLLEPFVNHTQLFSLFSELVMRDSPWGHNVRWGRRGHLTSEGLLY